jgi:hypothetical protein
MEKEIARMKNQGQVCVANAKVQASIQEKPHQDNYVLKEKLRVKAEKYMKVSKEFQAKQDQETLASLYN